MAGRFSGLTFAITGKLSRKRDEVVQLIGDQGGFVADRVTGATDYLVVGDTGQHGVTTKMREAHKRKTRLIDEGRLWKIGLGRRGPGAAPGTLALPELNDAATETERALGL